MLRVPTYLGKSSIHGLGVFAARDIQEGEIVWQNDFAVDVLFDPYSLLDSPFKVWVLNHAYLCEAGWVLSADNGLYTNHSNDPNTRQIDLDQDSIPILRAVRLIKAGEEITTDYKEFDESKKEIG